MNLSLPRQSPAILTLQCFIVLFLGLSLYLYLHCRQEENRLQTAISQLKQQQEQFGYAKNVILRYGDFIAEHPFYRQKSTNLKWEQVSEVWDDPSYGVLMKRLVSLYKADRPFILEEFSASLVEQRTDVGAGRVPVETGGGAESNITSGPDQRVFHLKGYFLCPCR